MGTDDYLTLYQIRHRLGIDAEFDAYWLMTQRLAYRASKHEAIMLNMGNHRYEAFTISHALGWAEREAHRVLVDRSQ